MQQEDNDFQQVDNDIQQEETLVEDSEPVPEPESLPQNLDPSTLTLVEDNSQDNYSVFWNTEPNAFQQDNTEQTNHYLHIQLPSFHNSLLQHHIIPVSNENQGYCRFVISCRNSST